MELIVRAYASDGRSNDLVVDVEASHRIADLARALSLELELADTRPTITLLRTGIVLDPDSSVGDSGIISGDNLVVGPPQRIDRVPAIPVRAVTLDVLAGPDAGTSLILLQGRFAIGRDPSLPIRLTDATVSAHHVDITVAGDWSVTLEPRPGIENDLACNGRPVDQPTRAGRDDVITLGATRIAFRPFVRAPGERLDQLGQIEFQRTPYRPPVMTERAAPELGRIPTRPDPRRFQVLTAMAPLGAGLTMYAFSGQAQFLALTLMSPLVVVANWFEDRRSGRSKFRSELDTFRQSVEARRAALAALVEAERVERVRAAPDLADLARRAEMRTSDLWARGRGAPDFLRLRVGLGDAPTMVTAPLERSGDEDLRAEAIDAAADSHVVGGVPVTCDLAARVLGVHGSSEVVPGVASALVVQAACLHSPEDLTIAAAVAPERPMADWLKWLPHLRSVTSPLSGGHVATAPEGVDELVARLLEVAEFRSSANEREREARRWPWILVVIDGQLEPDPAAVAQLLDHCPQAGISVIWLAETEAKVPRQASTVLAARATGTTATGTLWSTDPAEPDRVVEVEQIRADIADRVARSLAPVRDASTASLATSIPRTAPLLDVLGTPMPTPAWVSERWHANHDYGLRFPVGIGADGVLTLDLVADGPHALIGGTSGAGKSELLQSIVASLAVEHPPDRLNFLFVDYKGGASSTVFTDLPHTVGYVTNLSAELSLRALTSLRAELNRRMRLMEGRAKDLAEMLERHPRDAPASLVIVVDEFATLVKEVPEFVAGIVDIAQRGRSLGIHLILATQRPSGSVNDNILANTNLRISLRMLDRAESTAVINSGDAAEIPVPLKGRGYVRRGPRQLVAFQAAFCGAPLTSEAAEVPVLVAPFRTTDDSPKAGAAGPSPSAGTHLDAVLRAVSAAAARTQLPVPAQPWREVLPELVPLDAVLADARAEPAYATPGRTVPVGMIDAPEQQDQYPALIDLEEGSGWLVFGSGGSGRTSLLRTVAAAAAATSGADDVVVIGFDFASRALGSIAVLPQVVDVAAGDDLEAVTRHIAVLDAELERRRALLAGARAEHLTAYNARHDPLPRVLVLVDGFGGLVSAFASGGGGLSSSVPLESWLERFVNLVVEGRQVGIHVVVTADRRAAVPSRLHAAVSNRLLLRHADELGYTEHGVPGARAKALALTPGRGLWQADAIVQIAAVSADPSSGAQAVALTELAGRLERPSSLALRSEALPEKVTLGELAPVVPGPHATPLGVADVSGETVVVDLAWSNFTVAGPARSGRTTTLVTAAAGLQAHSDVWTVGPASSALADAAAPQQGFGRAEVMAPVLEQLANLLDMGPSRRPQVLVIDDVDTLDDATLTPLWERLVRHDELRIVASLETRSMTGYTMSPVLNLVRRARRLLLLQPDDANEVVQVAGVKAPIRPGQRMVPGRGVLVTDRIPAVVQVALP